MGGWWRWALVSPDGVAPSGRVGVSASVNLPLHHKVQKFSSGTGSPGWSRKKGRKTDVVVGGKELIHGSTRQDVKPWVSIRVVSTDSLIKIGNDHVET